MDMSVNVAGLNLKNPLILGAGPQTKNFNMAKKCIESGCGAFVTRSIHPSGATDLILRELYHVVNPHRGALNRNCYSFCSTGVFSKEFRKPEIPTIGSGLPPTIKEWAEEVSRMAELSKKEGVILIASIGMIIDSVDVWIEQAKMMERAGADAIELHLAPTPVLEAGRLANADPERFVGSIVRAVTGVVGIPVLAKLTVDSCDVINLAKVAKEAGADGVVITGRFRSLYIDMDVEARPVWQGPHGIGGPWVAPILCEKVFALKKREGVALPELTVIPSGGIVSGEDLARFLLVGADGAQVCSQILLQGYRAVRRILKELERWMEKRGYDEIGDFHGKGEVREIFEYLYSEDIPYFKANIDEKLCTRCGECMAVCTDEAIQENDDGMIVNKDKCKGCMLCSYICPKDAISMSE